MFRTRRLQPACAGRVRIRSRETFVPPGDLAGRFLLARVPAAGYVQTPRAAVSAVSRDPTRGRDSHKDRSPMDARASGRSVPDAHQRANASCPVVTATRLIQDVRSRAFDNIGRRRFRDGDFVDATHPLRLSFERGVSDRVTSPPAVSSYLKFANMKRASSTGRRSTKRFVTSKIHIGTQFTVVVPLNYQVLSPAHG